MAVSKAGWPWVPLNCRSQVLSLCLRPELCWLGSSEYWSVLAAVAAVLVVVVVAAAGSVSQPVVEAPVPWMTVRCH